MPFDASESRDPSLCWDCANATRPWNCQWVRSGKPVNGWIARKTIVNKKWHPAESYHVLTCPKFVRDSQLGGMENDEEAKHKVELSGHCVDSIAEAIVQRAVEDWIALCYGDMSRRSHVDGYAVERREVLEFFYTDWCKELLESFTDYTPADLRRFLHMEEWGKRYGFEA